MALKTACPRRRRRQLHRGEVYHLSYVGSGHEGLVPLSSDDQCTSSAVLSHLCDCRVELIEDRTVQALSALGRDIVIVAMPSSSLSFTKSWLGLLPPNRRIESGVFIETEAGFRPSPACGYHPSQERARPVLGVSSLFEHHFQNGKDSVETDEICQCQWTHGMIKP